MRPFKILEKDERAQEVFRRLGSEERISEEVIAMLEEFVCKTYGKKKIKSFNETRLEIFLGKYKSTGEDQKVTCAKKLDGSSLLGALCHHVQEYCCIKYLELHILHQCGGHHRYLIRLIKFQKTWDGCLKIEGTQPQNFHFWVFCNIRIGFVYYANWINFLK